MKYKLLPPFLLFIFLGVIGNMVALAQLQPAIADSFLNFIQANKDRSSIYISVNDTAISQLNEHTLMPLASTVKILVAVEFAKQAGAKTIDKDSFISLKELDKYYLPNTDGGAHPAWLSFEQSKNNIKNDSVKLIDVARGMIMFSSNANAEYLMDLLGVDNINNDIGLLGIKDHTPVFPLVSSLFLYQNPKQLTEEKALASIRELSEKEYCKYLLAIHQQLKNNPAFKSTFRILDLSLDMQKLWSSRLPASTTKDYVHLAKILNNRNILDKKAYSIIATVMEFPMETKGFQAVFKRYGVKGGSTGFVLTHVIYLTTQKGERIELAIFFNNLTTKEEKQLERWIDPFEAQVIFDKQYWGKLKFQ